MEKQIKQEANAMLSHGDPTIGTDTAYRRRHKAPEGECSYCDSYRQTKNDFHPPHDASQMCESGWRDHCTCDCCF